MLSFLDNETFAREVEKFRHCLKIVDKTTEVLKGASIDFQNGTIINLLPFRSNLTFTND
ncbi:hypothetical protein IC220_07300 [Wolbachia endosymbiont of Pentalonia nigronervosa]|uniref:hypothetical protein n=1 Tax=Wolbachia endosymbiont of Pentalonia nigronervosa TaxID=1301914 RepID=UPI00165FAF2B|nr:hypothetical protein [Wolbachia endosymbiont of Pentalonia nigronervosa]MBD0392204.1 hypothetical protein [Wolbachia endosymbiont of Pentalonia nigronervosa]